MRRAKAPVNDSANCRLQAGLEASKDVFIDGNESPIFQAASQYAC